MNLTLSCIVIFLAFAMTCLTGPVEGRPRPKHVHGRPRSSRSNSNAGSSSGSDSDSSDEDNDSDEFDPCAANPCKNNGTCSKTGINHECACLENYVGKNFDEFDPCAANPCKNNGTCRNTVIDYECACLENYVGKNCEEFDPCAANPCKNNGTCSNTDTDYECACLENYVGKNCEGSCPTGWVLNDGTCYYFSQDKLTWELARTTCLTLSMNEGHLVEVLNAEEQIFLNSQVGVDDYHWMGANDIVTEGVFTWTGTGNSISFTWNNVTLASNDGYDCVQFSYQSNEMTWLDVNCDYNQNYVCEMKPVYN